MNEKVAKKMGEAYAFAQVFGELCTTSETALSDLLGTHAAEAGMATARQRCWNGLVFSLAPQWCTGN